MPKEHELPDGLDPADVRLRPGEVLITLRSCNGKQISRKVTKEELQAATLNTAVITPMMHALKMDREFAGLSHRKFSPKSLRDI